MRMGARRGRLEMFSLSPSLSRSSFAEEFEEQAETEVNEVQSLGEGDEVVEEVEE